MIQIGLYQCRPLRIDITHSLPVIHWPDDFRLEVMVRAISKVNRFTGQTPRPYSVAEHSTRLSYLFTDLKLRRASLLHDAAEGLGINDLNFAVKEQMCPQIGRLEDYILADLWVRYGGTNDSTWYDVHKEIKALDRHLGNWEYMEFDLGGPDRSLYTELQESIPELVKHKNTGLARDYTTPYAAELMWRRAWHNAGGALVTERWK